MLNAILKLKFQFNIETYDYPEIPFDFEYQCLNSIQQSGTGRVSELVAKWLAQFGFNPSVFVNKNDLEFQSEIRNEEKNNGAAKFQLVEEFNKANEARGRSENIDLLLSEFKKITFL